MSEENTGAAPGGGDLHPAAGAAAQRTHAENPRVRGHSPARDSREQQAPQEERMVKVRDSDHSEQAVVDALAFKAEQDVRKQSLPPSPDKYEVKLPPSFKAPEGVKFEFDMNDPALKNFREMAHARGMDQETFSDALGIYAANKISEQQRLAPARAAELSKLGSAAENRINSVETWLKARVGNKADLIVSQMRAYPVAAMVETFETLMRDFSNQGGADFTQHGRSEQERPTGKIAGYENMTFAQKRAAQTAEMLRNNPAMASRAGQK
jgi:hypothetical protein